VVKNPMIILLTSITPIPKLLAIDEENTFKTKTFLKKGPKVESTKTSKEMVSMLIFADFMHQTFFTVGLRVLASLTDEL